MEPTLDDVQAMVAPLMGVVAGIERAKRKGPAATLALLYVVAARQPIRPTDLSAEMGLHLSSITRQVQALSAAGQLEVTPDPKDGRSCFVSLSEAGRKEVERLTRIGLERFALFVEGWDPAEVRTLAALLTKLLESQARVAAREAEAPRADWRSRKERAG